MRLRGVLGRGDGPHAGGNFSEQQQVRKHLSNRLGQEKSGSVEGRVPGGHAKGRWPASTIERGEEIWLGKVVYTVKS